MKNKKVKQMVCDAHKASNRNVEFATFRKSLYAWHYPPCEGGWFIYHKNKVSLTADQLMGK